MTLITEVNKYKILKPRDLQRICWLKKIYYIYRNSETCIKF